MPILSNIQVIGRTMVTTDWQDAEWDDEFDEPADEAEDADETSVITCQHCGRDMYEDAVQCPACGLYATREGRQAPAKPRWQLVGAVAAVLAILTWFLCSL